MKNIKIEDRAYRGGSWLDAAGYCRASFRGGIVPGDRSVFIGFRVVLHRRKA